MRLHMLGIPHTRSTSEFSHCAFTGKVRRWAKMMQPLGYECIHYGVGQPDSPGWAEAIEIMTIPEQCALLGYDPADSGAQFIGRDANIGHPLYVEFNRRLQLALRAKVRPGDVICAPFGHGHRQALEPWLQTQVVETGIGYPDAPLCSYRIYESAAWLHRHVTAFGERWVWDSEFVVPNYFDPEEWPLRPEPLSAGKYVLFMGRFGALKGLNELDGIAEFMPEQHFVICGQGNPAPWLKRPNVEYREPVHGMARAELMHGARCFLAPSRFLEPFGGVAVEAMMTGLPAVTTDHSAFRETVPFDSLRCHTLSDYITAINLAVNCTPKVFREYAISRYSLQACGEKYDRIFRKIAVMREKGWYA